MVVDGSDSGGIMPLRFKCAEDQRPSDSLGAKAFLTGLVVCVGLTWGVPTCLVSDASPTRPKRRIPGGVGSLPETMESKPPWIFF